MTIKVMINVKNMDLGDRLQEYITKKVEKLDRYLDLLQEAKVDLQYVKSARNASDRQVVQLTVRGKGVLLRAEERTDDIFASVDAVMDKMYRQIERYKGRRWRGRGDGRSASDLALDVPESSELTDDLENVIVRRKRFVLTPMDELEAVEQMSLVGHEEFFIFLNTDSQAINVLYRRRDGTLGLIEPETG
jgi:putative sigma-54 modulation protein